jgi:hypothetical protein
MVSTEVLCRCRTLQLQKSDVGTAMGLRYWHGTLLATSSALAIVVATGQSAEAQCALNNNAGGSNNAGAINCISYNNGVNNTGDIVNQGG